jgi:hypothetical protein
MIIIHGQRSDLQPKICRNDIFLQSVTNTGMKLYHKLSSDLKDLEKIKLFRRKVKSFLLQQIIYSVLQSFITENVSLRYEDLV